MKTVKLSDYFMIKKPTYIYYHVIPLKSLRNYNTDKLIAVLATMYKKLTDQITREDKKFIFTQQSKVAYYMYMEHNRIEFYFIIPNFYETLMKEKISSIWKGVTIEKTDSIPLVDNDAVTYCMNYEKADALSLMCDKRSNVLMSAITNTTTVMQDGDKVAVLYNFMPCSRYTWRSEYDNAIQQYKDGFPLQKDKTSAAFIFKLLLKFIEGVCDMVMGSIVDIFGADKKANVYTHYVEPLQPETLKKREQTIVQTQIVVMSSANDVKRAKTNAVACCEAFGVVGGDNTLTYRKCQKQPDINAFRMPCDTIKTTALECQNFIALPGKEIIEEHHINCIDTLETQAPKELTDGKILLGHNIYKGEETAVYESTDKDLKNLPLCVTGATRSGKTTFLENLTSEYLNNGECVIAFDFCGACEFSNRLSSRFKDSTLTIDCSNTHNFQGLGYNEIPVSDDVFIAYRNAKMQCIQLSSLINACNEQDKNLKAKMDRYLESAALVTFISGGNIKDVFDVLQDHKKRYKRIGMIPVNQKKNLEEYVRYLKELDEADKKTGEATGTVYRKIEGIIDRLNVLKRNTYIELMLKTSCDNNFNLYKEIQKNQLICIKMPENMFTTQDEKDIFCTYWYSKIWLTLQLRKNDIPDELQRVKVNIIIDELYQVERCQLLIKDKLNQMSKFSAKLIVSCHSLNQDKIQPIRQELKSSNASYIIIQGSHVSNFDSLKQEFENQNYTADDLINLKRFHSLNLITYEGGSWAGVCKLPPKQ